MVKKVILTCDHCDIVYDYDVEDEIDAMREAFDQDWMLVTSWFGEKAYCSRECFDSAFGV